MPLPEQQSESSDAVALQRDIISTQNNEIPTIVTAVNKRTETTDSTFALSSYTDCKEMNSYFDLEQSKAAVTKLALEAFETEFLFEYGSFDSV